MGLLLNGLALEDVIGQLLLLGFGQFLRTYQFLTETIQLLENGFLSRWQLFRSKPRRYCQGARGVCRCVRRSLNRVDELLLFLNAAYQACAVTIGENIGQDIQRVEVWIDQCDGTK